MCAMLVIHEVFAFHHFQLCNIFPSHIHITDGQTTHTDTKQKRKEPQNHPYNNLPLTQLRHWAISKPKIKINTKNKKLNGKKCPISTEQHKSFQIPSTHTIISIRTMMILQYNVYVIPFEPHIYKHGNEMFLKVCIFGFIFNIVCDLCICDGCILVGISGGALWGRMAACFLFLLHSSRKWNTLCTLLWLMFVRRS